MNAEPPIAILLVDDNPMNLTLTAALLEPAGYRIVEAASGDEALRCALADDFAVILLDVHMPGLGGVETARLLRQRERSRRTPIIFVTASDAELASAREGYDVGAVDYLFTPIMDRTILLAKVAVFAELFRTTTVLEQQLLERKKAEAALTLELAERKRAEAALAASEQSIRLLMDSIAEGFYGVDPQGNCTRVNRSALRMLGYDTEEELLGRHIHELIHHTRPDGTPYPADECRMYQALRDRTGSHVDDEVFWRRDGTSFPVEYWSHPILRDGQMLGAVASFFDLTARQQGEAALRESEERYRSLVEESPDVIGIYQEDKLVFINATGARRLGAQNQEEIVGRNGREILHPDDRAAALERIQRRLAGETDMYPVVVRYRRLDGTTLPVEVIATPITFGGKVAVQFIARDITERQQAEAALRESEEKYRALVETTATGFLIVDAHGRVLDANAEYVRLTGHDTLAEITGRSVVEWTAPHDLERNAAEVKQCAERGGVRNLEIDYVNRRGEITPIEINATVIGSGDALRILTLCRDITERKQAEEALRESEEKWRMLFNESADGIILAHPETRTFRSVNMAICRMLGYSEAELLALGVADIHPLADLSAVVDAFQRQVRGELKVATELPVVRKDGSIFSADVTASIVVVAGEHLLLGAFRDVTERQRAAAELARHREQLEQLVVERTKDLEGARAAALSLMQDAYRQQQRVAEALAAQRALAAQLEDANKELESFSYSVSHDLRAPLRHIHGYVEMLERETRGQLADKPVRYLKTIAAASQSMGHLIDDLLSFSRMGRAELHEARVDLDRLVQECIRNLETDMKDRPIVWKIPPLPPVTGDPSLLRQVFANLLGNAVKYTRPRDPAVIEIGTVAAEVTRLTYPESGIDQSLLTSAATVFFVRDNGVGFDPQYAHKLFGVFQRLHRAEEFEGTGIGLANVRRIIARHGGRTWAEGKPGEGATFYFTLKGVP